MLELSSSLDFSSLDNTIKSIKWFNQVIQVSKIAFSLPSPQLIYILLIQSNLSKKLSSILTQKVDLYALKINQTSSALNKQQQPNLQFHLFNQCSNQKNGVTILSLQTKNNKLIKQNMVLLISLSASTSSKKQEMIRQPRNEIEYFQLHKIRCFPIQFKTEEQMNNENIFIDLQRWNQYSHSLKQLESLREQGSYQLIKNYFLNETISASMLRRITNRQIEKTQGNLRNIKVKQIYKEKTKKLRSQRKCQQENDPSSAKFSSKTKSWSSQEEQVSQYLNFQIQQDPQILKVE